MASPFALICLGGMLSFRSMRHHRKKLGVVIAGRLFIVPVIGLAVGILLGYRDVELVGLLAVFASPTAVASGPMAQAMGGNGQLAGEIHSNNISRMYCQYLSADSFSQRLWLCRLIFFFTAVPEV